jgi:hypothetical protein
MDQKPSLDAVMQELAELRREVRGLRSTVDVSAFALAIAIEEIEPSDPSEDLVSKLLSLGTKESSVPS